jgi:hypothetical protein
MRNETLRITLVAVLASGLWLDAAAQDREIGSAPATISTWSDVRVETTDGWAYRDVTLRVDEAAGIATLVRADGAEKTFALDRIAAVFAASGEDITARVLPGSRAGAATGSGSNPLHEDYKPGTFDEVGGTNQPEVALFSGRESGPVPRLFNIAPSFGIGYGFPLGGFYDGLDSGLSFHGSLRAMISPNSFLDFVFRSTDVYSESLAVVDPYAGPVTVSADMDIRQYLVMIGSLGPPTEANIVRGYFEAGAGYADHVASASNGEASASASLGRLVFAMQGGFLVPLGQGDVGLDFSIHTLAKLIGEETGEDPGFIFGVQAAFVVFVGGE